MSLELLTIQYWLQHHARYRPDHLAIIFEDKKLSYKQLNEEVNQLSNALIRAGIRKGDKVATLLPNCLELWEIYWACALTGAVAVPLSPLLRGQGLFNLLDNADTRLLITNEELTQHVEELRGELVKIPAPNFWVTDADNLDNYTSYHLRKQAAAGDRVNVETVTGDDPYNIIYSSGTTGLPKGIIISHAVRALYGSLFANAFRMTPESVVLHSGAIIFNGSFLTLMPAMFLGCTYVLQACFDPHAVTETIRREKVTHTILVPSQIVSCMQLEEFNQQNLNSIEYILSVGAPLLLEHKEELNRRVPGIFYELYGLTEGFMTILDKKDAMSKTGSVGRPPQFMFAKIVDENGEELATGKIGEIVGKGPLLMTGYYKNEVQTSAAIRDGWLYTGDIGYLDKDGFLFLTGRKKDLIISGGVNVYPADIEEIVVRHPAVKDVAVFGIAHKEWGETPVAAVVLKEHAKNTSPEELQTWANNNLEARYQKIYKVVIIDELPRNIAGKVLKRELRLQFAE